ncbi:MAG: hypothetical protein ACP5OG_05180 [Candidatus Nanoarchaeia archaeon]
MTIIVDASSLILLAKISLLEKLIEQNQVIIPEKVYIEVIKGKEKAMLDALLVEKLVDNKKVLVQKVDTEKYDKIFRLFGLWAGEAEVLALAIDKKLPIITDDKKCLNASRAANIPAITALDVVIVLFKKEYINKEKAIKALETLEEYGWYKKDIIKFYKEKIK